MTKPLVANDGQELLFEEMIKITAKHSSRLSQSNVKPPQTVLD